MLEADSLTVRYGKTRALDGLSLCAQSGQVLALLGPNGAGKTTFVRTVATLIAPGEGTLKVRGHDVAREPGSVRREIGLAGQFAAVEPTMTGRENLEMVARLFGHQREDAHRAAAAAIELLELGEVADNRTRSYSGGQRRRLDFGASLVGGPRLLLLDEPTTGLDPVGRAEVWSAIRGLVTTGTDVVLTTHYLEEADELADQVVVIDHGRSIANGSVAELKSGIGRDVLEVVAEHDQLATVARILERVTGQPAVIDAVGRRTHARANDGLLSLRAAVDAFEAARVNVEELALRRPTLDEVFFVLTSSDSAVSPERESA